MNKLVKYIIESRFNFNIDLLEDIGNEEDFSLSRQLYKSKSMKQEYIENNLFVDLGLPSGTKWCKYNLGCNFGLLSSNPESTSPKDWYGNYYAWGEIKSKRKYDYWDTYKFEKNISYIDYNFVKYCTKPKFGYKKFTDNLSELLPEDDAAYQYDSRWRIPTKELYQELIDYTTNRWISGEKDDLYMNVKGLRGGLFTSKINGNQIFIPAAGYKGSSSIVDVGSGCYLWSSSLYADYPYKAYYLSYYSGSISMDNDIRCSGRSVRAVLNEK